MIFSNSTDEFMNSLNYIYVVIIINWKNPIIRIINISIGAIGLLSALVGVLYGLVFIPGIITIIITAFFWIGSAFLAMVGWSFLSAGIKGISPGKPWGDMMYSIEVKKARQKAREIEMVEAERKKL